MANIMSLHTLYEDHDNVSFTSGRSRGDKFWKKFGSTSLPSADMFRSFRLSQDKRKVKLDPTCLIEFGSIQFDELVISYFINSISAGYPSDVDDPFAIH